jgi:hypothetical protein
MSSGQARTLPEVIVVFDDRRIVEYRARTGYVVETHEYPIVHILYPGRYARRAVELVQDSVLLLPIDLCLS